MVTIFISDLHLEEKRPIITELFLDFLRSDLIKKADALYILGDFFEAWIGDDDLSAFNLKIIHALKTAAKILPIYVMHGNRDFLLGKKFFQMTGCRKLPDEYVISLYGTPTLLMHGDTLCTEDKAYLKFRKKSRCWFFQKLFLLKSLKKRRAIAQHYREASQAHTSTLPDYIMDVIQAEVERVMLKHRVSHLIHGHTHRQAMHSGRTVLGAWHEQGNALVWDASGKKEFIIIPAI